VQIKNFRPVNRAGEPQETTVTANHMKIMRDSSNSQIHPPTTACPTGENTLTTKELKTLATDMRKIQHLMDNSWGLRSMLMRERVVRQLGGTQKVADYYHQEDERRKRGPQWMFGEKNGVGRFFKRWDVIGEAELRWKYSPHEFTADGWLKTSRKKMMKWLDCSKAQLNSLIKMLKQAGVISTKHFFDKKNKISHWWIYLHPERVETLLKRAGKMKNPGYPGAKLKGNKAASTEGNRSARYRTSINIVPSSCSPAKDKIEIKKKERENNCLPGEGNSGTLSSPPNCAPLDPETQRVITHLKEVFPHSHFTPPALQQLQRLVTKLLPGQRLTEERARHYVRIYHCGGYQGRWEMAVNKLDMFIDKWWKIRKCLHVAVYGHLAASASYDLKTFTNAAVTMDDVCTAAENHVDRIKRGTRKDATPTQQWQSLWAQHIADEVSAPVRWLAANLMGVDLGEVDPKAKVDLRNSLHKNPGLYRLLGPYLPFDEWAGISGRLSAFLKERAAQAHWKLACTATMVPASEIY
jgi:hypothetical protein